MKKKFSINTYNYNSLIVPIVFLILGIVLLTNSKVVTWSLYLISLVLFVFGLFKNLLFYKKPEDKKDVITGTVFMTVGLILAILTFFALSWIELIFRISLAILFVYTGIIRIIKAFKQPKNIKRLYIVSSILIILCALLLAVFTQIEMWSIGLIVIVYSIIEIAGYIINTKYVDDNNTIKEAEVVKEIEHKDEE